MAYCIVDLECTCWDREDPNRSFHEIIEIGAVLLDDNLEEIAEFQTFVRPTFNRTLSEYCKDLTSITQEQVDHGFTFEKAMQLFEQWVYKYTNKPVYDIVLISWGAFDRSQFENDCERCGYLYPFNRHYNLKIAFSKFIGKPKRKFGLMKAAQMCGIPFEGTHHRGIDDAKIVAKLFRFMEQNRE